MQSVPLGKTDEVLITSHQYNAVNLAVRRRCEETNASLVEANIPIPQHDDDIIAPILEAVTDRTRLAIVDHITSATALVFPVKRIVTALREKGVKVLIDGAHAVGQLDLDISDIDPDWYVTNAHKWLFAPKGSALFYARATEAKRTRPAITSHFVDLGFPGAFDYVGTRDYSAWLATPAALDFYRSFDDARLRVHARDIIAHASERFGALGARPLGPIEMSASMRVFELPTRGGIDHTEAVRWGDALWDKHKLEIKPDGHSGKLRFRISAPAYVDRSDIDTCAHILRTEGWPDQT
ncbi:MAG: aminotransferase class V-fold PLP-dependent enzyme [Terricaulis sp.]